MFTLDDMGMEDVPIVPEQEITEVNPDKGINTPVNNTVANNNTTEDNEVDIIDDDEESLLGNNSNQTSKTNTEVKDIKDTTPEDNLDNISVFAKALQEEGLLDDITEDDLKEINSLSDVVKYAQKTAVKSALDNLTPTQQRYMASLEAGIEINEFEQLEKQLQSLENLTDQILETDLEQQFTVIAHDLINKGMDRDEAVDLANLIINQPNGLQKALLAKDALYKAKLKTYNDKVNTKKESNLISVDKTKELVNSKDKVLGKVSLTKGDKDKIFSNMTTRVDIIDGQQVNAFSKWRKEQGIEAEFILNTLMVLTDNFTSLGKLGISAKSAASKALEDKLRQAENAEATNTKFSMEDGDYNFNF